jgi:hypothetical protein
VGDITERNAVEAAKEAKARAQVECGPSSVRKSLSLSKLAMALCKAQSEMRNPPKDSVNPHFKSRYADLATVRDTVMPVLTKNGLSVLQLPCECDGAPALTTLLMHESGEYVETTMLLRPGKTDPQGVGSALTYARRYSLQSLAGVAADDDDDGNAASRPTHNAPVQQQKPTPTKASAEACRAAIERAASRDDLMAIWRQFDGDVKANKFTEAEKSALDHAFKIAGKKFPPAEPAKP